MLKIKSVAMRNFMSVGAVTQSINLHDNGLTLILGDNVDQGSNGSRNGAGKSVILHAISYGLFGVPLTNIKRDNLINKTNQKNMLVQIEFEKNGHSYTIERGRKPQHFKYIVDNSVVNESNTDEAQGDSRVTQEEINNLLGFSPLIFKHIIALTTKTVPFLNEKAQTQRDMIEELLGITQLSAKAETLRELIRETKAEIDREEIRIKVIKQQNEKTLRTINEIKSKSSLWENSHRTKVQNLEEEINKLMAIEDIDAEIEAHKIVEHFKVVEQKVKDARQRFNTEQNNYNNLLTQIERSQANYNSLLEHKCHACGQKIHDDDHERMLNEAESELQVLCEKSIEQENIFNAAKQRLEDKELERKELGKKPETFYNSAHDAYQHKSNFDQLVSQLEREVDAENPFLDQITTIEENNFQEINYDALNTLTRVKEHQELLLRILTDKNSWVRKQIIEQNLGYLNHRLDDYLHKLGLPHKVRFLSDLSVEILKQGQNFDFDNLSTGEGTRLVLALSWAFRDIFETLNFPINLMFIDELVDAGMDASGAESSLAVLKYTTREFGKNIFLISHKEEFIARVSNVLIVQKEAGFTTYNYESDVQLS